MGSSLSCTVRSDRVETDGGQGGTPLEKSRLRRLLNAQQTNTQNSTSREASPVSGTSEKKNDQSRSPKGLDFHVLVHCIYKECRKGSELTLKEKMEVLRLSVEEGKADTASAVFLALVKIHGALRAEPKKEKDPLPALPSPPPVSSSLDPPTDPPDHKQEGRKEKSADAEKSTKKEKHVDETEACAAAVAQLAPSALRVALQGNAQSVPPSRRLRLIREAERIAGELPEGAAAELDSALKTILPQSWQASFDGQTCRVWNYWKLGGGERSVHFVQSRLDRGLKVGGKCRVSVRFLGGLDWDRDEDPLPPRAFSKTQGNLTTFICYRTTRMARLQRELTKARAGKRKTSSAAQVSSEKETDKKQTEAPASSSEEKGKIGIDEVENGGGGVGEVSFRIFVEYRALQSVLFPSQPSESSALPPLTADEFRQIFPTPSSRSEASGAASEDEQEGKNERGEKETEQSDKRAEGKKKESKKEECPPWAPISVVELSGETRWCSLGLEGESGAPLFPLLAHEEHLPLPSGYCMRPFPSRSLVDEVDEAEAGRKEVQSARAGSGRGAGGGEQGSGGGAGRSDHPAVGAASSRRQQHVGGNGWGCSSPQSREEKEWEKQQLDKMYSASKTKEKTKKNEGGASSSSAYPPGGPVSPSLVSPQGTPLVWYPGLLGLSPSETIRILKAERDKEREKEKKAKTPNVSADVKHKADKDKGKALATGGGGKTAGSSVPKTKSSSPPLPTSSKTKRGPGQDEARDPKQEERKDKKEVGKKANGEEEKAKEKVEKKERKERERTEKEKEISCLSEEEKKEQEGKKKEEEKSMSNAPKIPPHFKSTDETDEKEGEKRKQDPPDPSQPPSAEKKKTEEQKTAEPGKGKACQTEPLSPRAQLKEGQEAACEKRKSEKALEQRETEPKGQDRKDIEKTTTVDKSTPADIDSFEEEEEEKKKKEKKQQKGSEDREGGANEEAKKEKEKETEAGQKREAEEVEQKNREEKETPEAISAPEKDTKRENNIEKEKKEKDDAIPPPSSAPADEEKRDLREKQTSNRPSSKERKEPEKETAKPPTAPTVTFPVEGHEKEKKEKGKEKSRTKDKHKEKEKERKPETDKENRLFPSTYKSTRCICDGCGKSIDYEKEGAWHAATDQYDLCALCGDVWPYPPAREVHLADEKNALWVLPHIANWVSVCGKGQGIASNPFNLSGVEGLTLSFYPNGNKADCLSGHCSLFLNAPAGTFWEFRMQVGDSAAADSSHEFKESDKGWGFKNFCALDAFVDKASDSVRLKLEVLEDVSRRLHRSFTKEEDSFVRDLAPEARERLLQGIVDLESYRSNKGRKEGEPADLSSPGAPLRLRLLALEVSQTRQDETRREREDKT
uniref:MATH domain-containing protein n=1 Tax=Chromera velia CCMP2878 TaxID=1169474 RepID=A0A0G4HES3_9ALVE|eukprot:Cvel_6589.t1-p1 / transcript=Cvel_6589.t1 / gene=Cvel_6589 / organism=Chromera_velia_CCMP2878 / gene_product=hypothetical protein / transcript_product=hypothetical protein / location=Cvel_scaffold325:40548-52470(+) / protein_length=1363 / sequence_SO=supercontig / SO=protein_coding / is_pseudo=false